MLNKKLIKWFEKNQRELPWRIERDPYRTWISEVMLQQTQVNQVIPYYQRFIRLFPDIHQLAKAPQKDILKAWEGMGYYNRARNLHRTAQIIVQKYQGHFPRKRDELIQLPGFGPYISNAFLSLAFNQPYGVMDGNVIRVITRIYGIRDDIRMDETQKKIKLKINQNLDYNNPGKFNEAMMELGALICRPKNPVCSGCPVNSICVAYKTNLYTKLPYRSPKPPRPIYTSLSFLISHNNRILLVQRPQDGLLAGLWEFPSYMTKNDEIPENPREYADRFKISGKLKKSWDPIHHSYTHFRLKLFPYWIMASKSTFDSDFYTAGVWILWSELAEYPLHKAIHKTIDRVDQDDSFRSYILKKNKEDHF